MPSSIWLRLAIVAGTLAALVYLARALWGLAAALFDVLMVIFLAWILAMTMRRLIRTIRRFLLPRLAWLSIPLAYGLVLLAVAVMTSLLVPLATTQALQLAEDLPLYSERVDLTVDRIQEIAERLGIETDLPVVEERSTLDQVSQAVSAWLADNALAIVQSATAIALQITFVFVLSIYIVVDEARLVRLFFRLIPTAYQGQARNILRQLDRPFFSYLRGISTLAIICSVTITIVMFAAGVPFALPLGIAAGLVQMVPIIGELIGIGVPIAVALVTTSSLTTAIVVAAVLVGFSLLMNNIVSPRILGRALQMPGLFVLLAVILGTRIAGVWGALLGVPVMGFIYSLATAWTERGGADGLTPASQSTPVPSPPNADQP